jgi:hypothetical protein
MKKNCFLLLASCFLLLASCRKTSLDQPETQFMIEQPFLRVDNLFPNGVLQFKSKESLKTFYLQLQNNSAEAKNLLPKNFASLRNYFNQFHNNQTQANTGTTTTNSTSNNSNDDVEEVGIEQYLYDMRMSLIGDSCQVDILNQNMQIMVGNDLFQLTRIGTFEVDETAIPQFQTFFSANENNIYYNPNYTSVPNETPLGNNRFEVFDGVQRTINPYDLLLDPGDIGSGGFGGGGTGFTPPNNTGLPTNFQYQSHLVTTEFDESREIYMSPSRRFKFEVFNNNFLGLDIILSVGIRGKLQRERKFLWTKWWGESYADEIVVGCDNMNLLTDYTYPTPARYNNIARPNFAGEYTVDLGNNVVNAIGIDFNLKLWGQPAISNDGFSRLINSQVNTLIGNQFTNHFTEISNSLISYIDPTFVSRYANHTKIVNALNEQNKYRFIIGKGERTQGYSHVNVWRFNYNFGTPDATYSYTMKSGSFFGRCRVGNQWYGIRLIKQP